MRKAALLVAAAAAFGLAGYAALVGPVGGAMVLIALGIVMAVAASGSVSSWAVAAGAVAAFAAGTLRPLSPVVAAAIFLGLCYAERTWRVRGRDKRALHVGLALMGGALAGAVVSQVAGAAWSVRVVGALVCAVLAALPQLVEADDTLAFSLDNIAEEVAEPAASHLREGAELRRTVDEAVLDRRQTKQARSTWASLEKLARARMRLEKSIPIVVPQAAAAETASAPVAAPAAVGGPTTDASTMAACTSSVAAATTHGSSKAKPTADTSTESATESATVAASVRTAGGHSHVVVRRVDQRIADHVQALARMYTAADAAKAAEMSLEDGPLRSVENAGESLEQMSQAFVEDV